MLIKAKVELKYNSFEYFREGDTFGVVVTFKKGFFSRKKIYKTIIDEDNCSSREDFLSKIREKIDDVDYIKEVATEMIIKYLKDKKKSENQSNELDNIFNSIKDFKLEIEVKIEE